MSVAKGERRTPTLCQPCQGNEMQAGPEGYGLTAGLGVAAINSPRFLHTVIQ